MRDFIKSKLTEANLIVLDTDPNYDSIQRCDDLRMIVKEVGDKAAELEQSAVLDICQSVRSGGIGIGVLRSTLVRCLEAIPPKRPVPLLTVDEVAAMLSVSVRSVWRMRSADELPEAVTLGKSIRWRQCDIEKFTKE